MSHFIASARLFRAFSFLAMLPTGLVFGLGMSVAVADSAPPAATQKEYRAVYQSATFAGGFTTGKFGQAIPVDLGAETSGVKSFDGRKLLFQWDVNGGARGIYAGSADPGRVFVGGRAAVGGELGLRLIPARDLSPYVGSGLHLSGTAIMAPSIAAANYDRTNSLEGLAGLTGSAGGRVAVGVSYLNGRNALNLTGFVQETVRTPANASAGGAFTQVGTHAEYDLSDRLRLLFEATYGKTGQITDPVFQSTTEASRLELAAGVRATLYKSFWMGLDGRVSQERNKTTYAGSPLVFESANQANPSITLSAGVALP